MSARGTVVVTGAWTGVGAPAVAALVPRLRAHRPNDSMAARTDAYARGLAGRCGDAMTPLQFDLADRDAIVRADRQVEAHLARRR